MREHCTYFTTSDVAKRLERSPDRIRQLARAGVLVPAIVTSRGERLYSEAEVERYERKQLRTTR